MGTFLVRIEWSGVAGPCCETAATSSRRQKARLSASAWRASTIGKPATSEIARRSRARSCVAVGRTRRGGRPRQVPRALPPQVLLGPVDEHDHPLVGLLRRGAEREDAVVHQHHADGVRTRFGRESRGAQPREIEARHHVGDDDDEVAVDLADPRLAVGGVGDRQHRVGVGVVDPLVRQDRVQDRLDRRRRRRRPGQVRRQLVDHRQVGQRGKLREPLQVREPHRREAGRLDGLEIPAAALDVQDVLVVAQQVALGQLDRGVAAAVQHQRPVGAEQPRRVAAQREVVGTGCGVAVVPAAFHARGSTVVRCRPGSFMALLAWGDIGAVILATRPNAVNAGVAAPRRCRRGPSAANGTRRGLE